MKALETLWRYLLSVNSNHAQMILLSVERFLMSKGRGITQMNLDIF